MESNTLGQALIFVFGAIVCVIVGFFLNRILGRQRADQEHALAVLTGRPPSELSLKVKPLDLAPPQIPPAGYGI